MAVRKIKGSWWVDFMYKGERLRRRSPDSSKASAEDLEVCLRRLIAQHGTVTAALAALKPQPRKKGTTFVEFSERWMRDYVDVHNKPSERYTKAIVLRWASSTTRSRPEAVRAHA